MINIDKIYEQVLIGLQMLCYAAFAILTVRNIHNAWTGWADYFPVVVSVILLFCGILLSIFFVKLKILGGGGE